MSFQHYKKTVLTRQDKSNKGSIDEPIKELIDTINRKPDYCTTSSCSGRIVVFPERTNEKKNEMKFTFVSHNKVSVEQITAVIKKHTNTTLWFRYEPAILHVACSSLEAAEKLLYVARQVFKHSGILSLGKHPVLEIRGSEFIEALVQIEKKTMPETVEHLCKSANNKLQRTHEQIEKLKIKSN